MSLAISVKPGTTGKHGHCFTDWEPESEAERGVRCVQSSHCSHAPHPRTPAGFPQRIGEAIRVPQGPRTHVAVSHRLHLLPRTPRSARTALKVEPRVVLRARCFLGGGVSGPRMAASGSIEVDTESKAMSSRPGQGGAPPVCGQQRGGCAGSALCADRSVHAPVLGKNITRWAVAHP